MTNIKMPEPVACLWIKNGVVVNAFNRPPRLLDGDPWSEYFIKKGFTEEPIITTTQAEAYANARVREALEEAARIIKANAEACHSDTRIMLRANAEAVLALLPKQSTPAQLAAKQ